MRMPPEKGFRRLDRYRDEHHARHLAPAHGQCRLCRLPSARARIDAHHPGAVRRVQDRCGSMDAPRRLRTDRRVHGEPACRTARRFAVQVFRRVDRQRRQGRSSQAQAAGAAGIERNVVVTSWAFRPDGTWQRHPASFLAKPDTDDTKQERGDIRAILRACKTGVQNDIETTRGQRRLT
jgi:hypothetical protein